MKKKADTQNIRVYEYIDEDGNVFWSFSESKQRIEVRKMELVDRIGLQFNRWNYEIKTLVRQALTKRLLADIEDATIVEDKNWGRKRKKN